MPETTHVGNLTINVLTKSQFNSATKNANQLYLITDEQEINPTSKTSEMTQAVGVDANGRLWTEPAGSSAAFPETVCLIKGNGLGGASAAVPGTDYALPTITDAGGYFTAGTIEGALQEIGAELSGINTLLGNGVIA